MYSSIVSRFKGEEGVLVDVERRIQVERDRSRSVACSVKSPAVAWQTYLFVSRDEYQLVVT